MLSARKLYLIAPQGTLKIPKAFIFFFNVNTFSCCLVLGQWLALSLLLSGCRGLKPSLLLTQPSCVLMKGPDWWFLLVLLLHDKYSLYFYYYTACRHFQTYWGRSCKSSCSSVNPVCWPTIERGVLFSFCYFKINWNTNHSNHFEIKEPHPTKLITQTKCLYSAWLEKIYQITIKLLHWLIYCGWVIKPWSALTGMLVL